MAADTQDTVRELKDLIVAYAKQETIEPLKDMRKYIGFGLGGALLLGLGCTFLAMSLLRVLQTETGDAFDGNWTWVPYVITIAALVLVAALVMMARRPKKATPKATPAAIPKATPTP